MQSTDLNDLSKREVAPRCWARFVHSGNVTVSYWDLEPGAQIPPHSHPHEQVTSLIEGEMEMTVGGETKRFTPGCVVVIPPNTSHAVKAAKACYVIDVFYPVREDYR